MGLTILLPKTYGAHLGISDEQFQNEGAEILETEEKVLGASDAILQLSLIDNEKFEKLKNDQFLIGVLNPYSNKDKIQRLLDKKINCFFHLNYYQELQELNQWIYFRLKQI